MEGQYCRYILADAHSFSILFVLDWILGGGGGGHFAGTRGGKGEAWVPVRQCRSQIDPRWVSDNFHSVAVTASWPKLPNVLSSEHPSVPCPPYI